MPSFEPSGAKLTVIDNTDKTQSEEANKESITTSTFTNTNPSSPATTQGKEEDDKGRQDETDGAVSTAAKARLPTPTRKTAAEASEGEMATSPADDDNKEVKVSNHYL